MIKLKKCISFIGLLAFSVSSQALQLENQPLRNLNLQESKLKLDSKLQDYAVSLADEIVLQNGKVIFGGADVLDPQKPFCSVKEIYSRYPGMPELESKLDIWGVEGKYMELFDSPVFKTTIRTSGLGGLISISCQKPSSMAFNEVTIGEFEAAVAPYIIFSKVGADVSDVSVKPVINLAMNLDPGFIYQPEKNLFRLAGSKDAVLGLTVGHDLVAKPSQSDPSHQESWYFQNKKIVSETDIKDKSCSVGVRSDQPLTLKKGAFLKAKSIYADYEKNLGLPGDVLSKYFNRFSTVVEFTTESDVEILLMCGFPSSLTPLSYNDTVSILGDNLVWTILGK